MFEAVRKRVLQFFRVPHDPDPPAGAPGSVRVFRAARNFYKLRLLRWGLGQFAALAGIVFSLTLLGQLQQGVEEVRTNPAARATTSTGQTSAAPPTGKGAKASTVQDVKSRMKSEARANRTVRRIAERWPGWLFPLLTVLKLVGVLLYLIQIPITYAMARLDYELRWYIVTDRSLRIRAGLAAVQETTMSFANVQQVVVSQGPLQRLLGIADLRVQSAGGGGDKTEHGGGESLHTGIFHGVDNANDVRDLILERLRSFREAGLGDPDELNSRPRGTPNSALAGAREASLAAARELLQEAKALRHSVG
jgi:membrane protein YdbS with pleckstrin-like domain